MNDEAPMSKVPLPFHTLENCTDSVIHGCRSAPATLIHVLVVGCSAFGIRHSAFYEPRLGCGFSALGHDRLDLWQYPLPEQGANVGVPYGRDVMNRLGLEGGRA